MSSLRIRTTLDFCLAFNLPLELSFLKDFVSFFPLLLQVRVGWSARVLREKKGKTERESDH